MALLFRLCTLFFLFFFLPTLILQRSSQVEDGARSFFFSSFFFPHHFLVLLFSQRHNRPFVSFDELKDYFHHRQRHRERRLRAFFSAAGIVQFSRDGLQNGDSFEFGLVRDGIPLESIQSRLCWLSGCFTSLPLESVRPGCVGWFNVLFIYLDVQ
jgi:hypothetical protein